MSSKLDALRAELAELQARLAAELASTDAALRYTLQRGRAIFDTETRAAHSAARERPRQFLSHTRLLHLVTAPVIYSMILPFALLDLFVTVYQAICFPVYHIEKVRRADHILIDRQFLAYLQPHAETELRLLQLLQRNCLLCPRNRRPDRSLLVPDQAFPAPGRHS